MPRSPRKKFQKFLAARQSRSGKAQYERTKTQAAWFDVFCAVLPPVLISLVYGLLWTLDLFSVLYSALHVASFVVLFVWVILAVRGTKGYWSYKADILFGLLSVLLFGVGACWGGYATTPVKAWVSAPAYARQAVVQLQDPKRGSSYTVLENSLVHVSWRGSDIPPHVRFAGQEELLETAAEGVDLSTSFTVPADGQTAQYDLVLRRGWRRIAVWRLSVLPDEMPKIAVTEEPEITARKTIRFAFKASDDYGVERIGIRIAPTASASGVSTEPVEMILASPAVKNVETASYADLTSLPWAGIPVTVQLFVLDGAGQKGWSEPKILTLPTRAFHNPFARALIEERQKFLSQPDNVMRDETANVMAGIARQQSLYHGDPVVMVALRAAAVRLVLSNGNEAVGPVSDIMWKAAVRLEEGALGHARSELAEAERDLSFALLREASGAGSLPYLGRVQKAMAKYFDVLEGERVRQPPALQEMDWPIATASEMLTSEDLQGLLGSIGEQILAGERSGARTSLAQLQALIENLRTTPPELTPEQAQIVQQVTALRALERGQKNLIDEMGRLALGEPRHEPKAIKDAWSRNLIQQQLLLSALRDVAGRHGLNLSEAKQGEAAMLKAIAALQQKSISEAEKSQVDALNFLQNCLSSLREQMRRSMTANAP